MVTGLNMRGGPPAAAVAVGYVRGGLRRLGQRRQQWVGVGRQFLGRQMLWLGMSWPQPERIEVTAARMLVVVLSRADGTVAEVAAALGGDVRLYDIYFV